MTGEEVVSKSRRRYLWAARSFSPAEQLGRRRPLVDGRDPLAITRTFKACRACPV